MIESIEIPEEAEEEQGGELVSEVSGVESEKAIDALRELRPFIERTGNREAKDAYNRAIIALKREQKNSRSISPAVAAMDAELRRRVRAEIDHNRSFEDLTRQYHRRDVRLHSTLSASPQE